MAFKATTMHVLRACLEKGNLSYLILGSGGIMEVDIENIQFTEYCV